MKTKLFKFFVLFFLFFSLVLIFYFYIEKTSFSRSAGKDERGAYFIPIQIEGNTYGSIPYLKVEIDRKEYRFILDLGFCGEASIDSECLKQISDKVFVNTSTSYGFQGKEYPRNIYQIPELKIGEMSFRSTLLEEEDRLFHIDSALIPKVSVSAEVTSGALGCLLFSHTGLCLDLGFSMIAFCDSFETVKKELQASNTFSKVPILGKNDLIEFEMDTSEGTLRCLLDTGSTSNHINMPNPENTPMQEFIKNEKHFDNVQIGGKDFGPITFLPLPINLPFPIDAIVGLDFLFEHAIFIDFVNREIYFDKSIKTKE